MSICRFERAPSIALPIFDQNPVYVQSRVTVSFFVHIPNSFRNTKNMATPLTEILTFILLVVGHDTFGNPKQSNVALTVQLRVDGKFLCPIVDCWSENTTASTLNTKKPAAIPFELSALGLVTGFCH